MSLSFPFLTAYDPPGSGEGTLDPLGLYQIADRLAIELVPVVRERMQRIRFLTAMTVGSMVILGIDDDQRLDDASPYLVWEWLVIEALVRTKPEDPSIWGAPGTLVAKRPEDAWVFRCSKLPEDAPDLWLPWRLQSTSARSC
jgi:hypothetical protein